MSRLAAAFAILLSMSAAGEEAASPKPALSRTAGKVLQARSKLAPGSDGPVFREGRLTILDKADHTEEFKATPRTKVTLDGKPAKFQKAAAAGSLVLKALYDPNTKELASLDLKSGPKPSADDLKLGDAVRGEVANTDVLKGVLSIRSDDKSLREFAVPETAKIVRETAGQPDENIGLVTLQPGDDVEVFSADGKTALEIHVRAAR